MNPEAHWKSLPPVTPPQGIMQKLFVLWPFWLVMFLFVAYLCASVYADWLFATMGKTPGRFTTVLDIIELSIQFFSQHMLPAVLLSAAVFLGGIFVWRILRR